MNNNGPFRGRVAFVTGAANGIGRASALAFAREGASVVVADVSEHGNHETTRMIEELGGRALAVRCDVSRAEEVKAALDGGLKEFGRLDFAFNNAGVEQPITSAAEITEEEWDRIIRVNLRGVFLCLKYEIPLMLKQGGGAIVNTSSGAGIKGFKVQAASGTDNTTTNRTPAMKIRLSVNNKVLTATLADNKNARDFISLLPLTLTMNDLFGREKYARLPRAISQEGKRTHTYQIGDLAYWSPSHDVAVYYRQDGEKIPEPGIIVIGKIDSGVAALDVAGSVKVTIELHDEQ